MPWKQISDPWSDAPPPTGYLPQAVGVGCAAAVMAVAIPAIFIGLAARKPDGIAAFGVGFVVSPVLAVFGLLIAPSAAIFGLVLWSRGRRAREHGRLAHAALVLNTLGFSWWLWLAIAWLVERVR